MSENRWLSRRRFLTRTSAGLGAAALASLLESASAKPQAAPEAKARNVIFLFMSGGPAQMDLFDPKPSLSRGHGEEMPASVLGTQRVTLMTRNQGHFRTASTPYRFRKVGQAGHDMSEM